MKTTILSSALLLFAVAASAQDTKTGVFERYEKKNITRIGFKAGLNRSTLKTYDMASLTDKRALLGWQAGAYLDLPVVRAVTLQAGLALSQKGARFTLGDNTSGNFTEATLRPLYLEVPLNIVFKLQLPSRIKLFAGAGPYAAMGVSGKNKLAGRLSGAPFNNDGSIEFGSGDANVVNYSGDFRRFDMGLNILAGVQVNSITFNAAYGHGIVDVNPHSVYNNGTYHNRVFSLLAGVIL